MFSIRQKTKISNAIQKLLRATKNPELPDGEIPFHLHVEGREPWSFDDIRNKSASLNTGIKSKQEGSDI